jgi:hypothetical protein
MIERYLSMSYSNCRDLGNRGIIKFVFGGDASAGSLRMVSHRGLGGGPEIGGYTGSDQSPSPM